MEACRKARPADVHGHKAFIETQMLTDTAVYICNEIKFHVEQACGGTLSNGVVETSWYSDTPQDVIVIAAGHRVGCRELERLAEEAEDKEDYWLSARIFSVLSTVRRDTSGQDQSIDPLVRSLDAIASLKEKSSGGLETGVNQETV